GLADGPRPRGRLRTGVRRTGHAHAQRRAQRVASIPGNPGLNPRGLVRPPPHSSFTPVASTTGPHLACSVCTKAANSSGVVGAGAAFWLSNCFFSSADVITAMLALRSVSRTSDGVRAGATRPYQLSELTAA